MAAPRQRNTNAEKAAIKAGKRADEIDPANTASDVWADSAYRSAENERAV